MGKKIKPVKRGPPLKILPNYTLADVIDVLSSYEVRHENFFHENKHKMGVCSHTDGAIYINNDITREDERRLLLLHEIGHAIYPFQSEKKILDLEKRMYIEHFGNKYHGVRFEELKDQSWD